MKVNGPYYDNNGERTELYSAQLLVQNGKKSRAIRARNLKGGFSKKTRRYLARWK